MTLHDVVEALVGVGTSFYVLAPCGHHAAAPAPSLENGDSEVRPAFVDCPECGMPRRVLSYDATGRDS